MKFLIAGLGNPGAEYRNTRHNIGFKALDVLAEQSDAFFSSERYADQTSIKVKGRQLILIKPNTYMNLSGKAIRYWMDKEKIPLDRILVITDDIALPFGKLRLRGKGSDGGHNGLKNIIQITGTPNFARIRFGVGDEFIKGRQVDYVLGEWSAEEDSAMDDRLSVVKDMVHSFCFSGLSRTMSDFNNR